MLSKNEIREVLPCPIRIEICSDDLFFGIHDLIKELREKHSVRGVRGEGASEGKGQVQEALCGEIGENPLPHGELYHSEKPCKQGCSN